MALKREKSIFITCEQTRSEQRRRRDEAKHDNSAQLVLSTAASQIASSIASTISLIIPITPGSSLAPGGVGEEEAEEEEEPALSPDIPA